MNNTLRLTAISGVLAVAAASQAVSFNFAGNGTFASTGTPFTVTSFVPTSSGAQFGSASVNFTSAGAGSTANLTGPLGSLLLTFVSTTDDSGTRSSSFSSTATAVGTYNGQAYTANSGTLTVTNNLNTTSGLDTFVVSGELNPVPEPASLAALAIGGLGLVRARRRKA